MTRKTLIISSSGIIFILLVLFLWNEKLSWQSKINDQKFTNFFFIIGAIGTTVSLFLLYQQILETRLANKAQIEQSERQRLLANIPDLYPGLTNYQMIDDEKSNLLRGGDEIIVYPKRRETIPTDNKSSFIYLFNIGMGTAKEIVINWLFDPQEILTMIEGHYYWHNSEPDKDYADFIPATDKAQINSPYFYLQCCGQRLNDDILDIIVQGEDQPVNKPKPDLRLHLTYKDIFGSEYEKYFTVHVGAFLENVTLSFREIVN